MIEENQNQIICYWPDGYWITDPEEAELLDSVNAFGAEHRQLEVKPDDDVQRVVDEELIWQEFSGQIFKRFFGSFLPISTVQHTQYGKPALMR